MPAELKRPHPVRFADFEFDCHSGDLRRNDAPLRLQPQPARVLSVLIRRVGQVVSRQELVEEVWGSDTFVDFEQGLNYAIRQIRTVLGDDAEQPRFVETLPKRGYRFIAPLKDDAVSDGRTLDAGAEGRLVTWHKTSWQIGIAFMVVSVISVALVIGSRLHHRPLAATKNRPIASLAVLPLRNLSQDPEQEYFSDGMTDELITELAKFGTLRVISHTSVERYKNTKRSLPDIARELGVDAIVEGAVLRSNDHVRITAQLIDARSDQHLWADSYERDLQDVLLLQDEVAQRITTQVGLKVAASIPKRTPRQVNSAAHEAYLKGNFYWGRSNCNGSQKGLQFYQEAVAKDPNFAPAYIGLAQAYFTLGDWGCSESEQTFSKSKAAALKALELDPTLGSAHAWLGTLAYFHEWDWENAEKEYTQAIDLDPNYAPAHLLHAVFLVSMGNQEKGLAEMGRAQELDPTAELTNMVSVHILYLARQYDRAIEQAKNAIQFNPDSWGTFIWVGVAYERKGMDRQAIEAYLRSKALQGTQPGEIKAFRSAYQTSGLRGYWQHTLETLKHNRSDTCSMITIYALTGQKEQTLSFLNQAIERHCDSVRTLKVDSIYDNLRDDPRFKELLTRLNL